MMSLKSATAAIVLLGAAVSAHGQALAGGPAPAAPPAPVAAPDYADGAAWLCRPGRMDACSVDMTAAIVPARGAVRVEPFTPAANPPIDCFYVYPTVSLDATPNSDMIAGPEELNVVRVQFARFASQCRTFAPLYRQATLTALRAATVGRNAGADRVMAYEDVRRAFQHYLEHDNQGRGFVLIGHSQGSCMLSQLIRNEIDGRPLQGRMVSAMLLGSNTAVPRGADVGGVFQHVPACRSARQIGCVISYVSFRDTAPPPPNSRFGRIFNFQTMQPEPSQTALCTNPANLRGGAGVLRSYHSNGAAITGNNSAQPAWTEEGGPVTAPFVATPGLLSARCVSDERGTYLSVHVNADPRDPRTDAIGGDVVANGQVQADWGLHLIDVSIAMGDLVDIVRQQARAYGRRR